MNMKRNTKKGSYIVEAVLVLPLFILSVIMISSLIPVLAQCENAVFTACDEIRAESVKAVVLPEPLSLGIRTGERIKEENRDVKYCNLNSVRYLYSSNGISDLITVKGKVILEKNSIMGLYGKTQFNLKVTGRAFTGKDNSKNALSDEEFKKNKKADPVYVFPDYGEKYHKKNCTYITAGCERRFLNSSVKRKYRPCKACKAKKAKTGSTVYCFNKEGKKYHMGNCKHVKRSYVEMEKEYAIKKGYRPCSKCGG